ncbi:U3 small nucleolar RNA-associated protein 15 [Neophaeococcomyces mojaviensis]|uniref:U3 small nucleolar RNA-associated protein 15 n=1 Tax=Neophaeococcomyces mojaviensis TaxID=3383035 RepID=A0ACC3AJ53_9EURO|nr:U3 small nucleolar RNA-associated protein 15 [Knufia sp. JES_112]
MAAEVQPVAQVKLPARPLSLSPEQVYWRSFKTPVKHASPTKHGITHISQPTPSQSGLNNPSDYFVVSTGARIQLYSTKTRKLVKTITRFDDIAYSGELRYDGRVLVAGDETGTIQAFDVNSRAILKTWKEQKQPVHVTKWNPRDTTSLMSCGDDATVRLWDLPTDNSVATFRGHHDYVRSGGFLPGQNSNILVSGSYDQTIRLWDARTPQAAVMTFQHSAPVEDVLSMPSGTTLLASAENQVAVLDIVAGKALHMIKNHQKTVASLCLASQGSRLVTGGLDGHMKVFETTGWNVVAASKYPAPILSLRVITAGQAREDKHVVVGMSDGNLSIKTHLSGEQKVRERERQKEMEALLAGRIEEHDRKVAKLAKQRGAGWERRFRGRDYNGESADIIIEGNMRSKTDKKMKPWDKAMHATRYAESLDLAMASKQRPIVLSVLTELRYRSALRAALENRDEKTLQPILRWAFDNISTTQYAPICVQISMIMMDLYSKHVGSSQIILNLVNKLHDRVQEEVGRSQQAIMTKGMLELLIPEIGG